MFYCTRQKLKHDQMHKQQQTKQSKSNNKRKFKSKSMLFAVDRKSKLRSQNATTVTSTKLLPFATIIIIIILVLLNVTSMISATQNVSPIEIQRLSNELVLKTNLDKFPTKSWPRTNQREHQVNDLLMSTQKLNSTPTLHANSVDSSLKSSNLYESSPANLYAGPTKSISLQVKDKNSTNALSYRNLDSSATRIAAQTAAQSQWVPVTGRRRVTAALTRASSAQHYYPTGGVGQSQPSSGQRLSPATSVHNSPLPQPASINSAPGALLPSSSNRQARYRPPMHHYGWRRPRLSLNGDYDVAASRTYKRVLLCDKTLVSLDYVRHLSLEPRPYKANSMASMPEYPLPLDTDDNDDDFGIDNLVDVDQVYSASNVYINRRNSSSSLHSLDTSESERRTSGYSLTDADPLVKCDMWDLEKGLKNRKPPEAILRMAIKADFDTVRDAINRCRQLSERTLPPEDEYRDHGLEIMSTEDLMSLFSMKRGLLPGTKWCGLGDQADNYNDLGQKYRIDICCRAHDHCPIRLKPFRNDYGVLNIALYTKSHCDCDADFYKCLREVRSRTADMLGNLYFNVMKLQCLQEERMKVCREMKPIALGFERCVRYEENPLRTVFRFTSPPVAY